MAAFQIPGVPLRGTPKASAINTKPVEAQKSTQNIQLRGTGQTETKMSQSSGRKKKGSKRDTIMDTRMPPVYVASNLSSNGDSSSSSGSEKFTSPQSRTIFYDDSKGTPVTFNESVPCIVSTQQLEQPQATNTVWLSKFMINVSAYHRTVNLQGSYVDRQYEIIFQQMSREIVKSIKSKVIDSWTFTNWFNAMQTAIKALEMFYTLDSIASYSGSDSARDKNVANITMQRFMEQEPRILFLKDDLRRMLKGVWFPTQFSELIRWTYQLYKTADLDQSTNYRFIPFDGFIFRNAGDTTDTLIAEIESILVDLNSINSVRIWSILSQVYPEGEIVGLPLSCSTAVYDPRHYEIFSNQPVLATNGGGTNLICPHSDNPEFGVSFVYGMNANPGSASGLGFVLQTLYTSESAPPVIDFFRAFKSVAPNSDYKSSVNKFSLHPDQYFVPRTWPGELVMNESADVHVVRQNTSTLEVETRRSYIPSGFQPVYFDIVTAPLINLREFMSSMFYII
jgi:ureidoglycolate hydrolase